MYKDLQPYEHIFKNKLVLKKNIEIFHIFLSLKDILQSKIYQRSGLRSLLIMIQKIIYSKRFLPLLSFMSPGCCVIFNKSTPGNSLGKCISHNSKYHCYIERIEIFKSLWVGFFFMIQKINTVQEYLIQLVSLEQMFYFKYVCRW